MNNLIIGIAGGSGSGKTTLALRLKERFGEDEVRLISHDSYYKRHDELPFEERCKLNYDHPDAFDNALLIYHLQELKAGRAIDCPVYDYSNHNRSNEVQHIEPAPVLIVEGILPFVEPELCALFDYKIFVDTDADERILRRILRDVKERGRSLDSVIDQYLTDARSLCRAQQAQRGHHCAQRRREQHRRGDACAPHPHPDREGEPGVRNPLRRSRARFPLLSPTVTSSPGAGEVFPLRESWHRVAMTERVAVPLDKTEGVFLPA